MAEGSMLDEQSQQMIGWRKAPYNQPAARCLNCGTHEQLEPLGDSPRKDVCPKCHHGHCFVAAKGRRARKLGRNGIPIRTIQNPKFPEDDQRKIHFVLQLVGKTYPERPSRASTRGTHTSAV